MAAEMVAARALCEAVAVMRVACGVVPLAAALMHLVAIDTAAQLFDATAG